jgi:tetratricopeptide (TPR) repeat protein
MDPSTATLISILKNRVNAWRAAGNLDEALHTVSAAVEKSRHALSASFESIDEFACSLELRGDLHCERGDFALAGEDYRQALAALSEQPSRIEQLGRLHAGLGAACDGLEQKAQAVEHWQAAVEYFQRSESPRVLDIAVLENKLGLISTAAGDLERAEGHLLRALETFHTQFGQEHEETAATSSNLGVVYQMSGFYEQAREMHAIVLETRRTLLGEAHRDTARSHHHLAQAMRQTGERSWARRHFEKSLIGFEALGPACSQDLKAVATDYCEFLRAEGEMTLADAIASRVQEVLGQPVRSAPDGEGAVQTPAPFSLIQK